MDRGGDPGHGLPLHRGLGDAARSSAAPVLIAHPVPHAQRQGGRRGVVQPRARRPAGGGGRLRRASDPVPVHARGDDSGGVLGQSGRCEGEPSPPLPPMPPPRPVPVAPKSAAFFGNFPCVDDAAAAALKFVPVGVGNLAMGNGLMPRTAGMGGDTLAVQTLMSQLDPGGKGQSDLSSPSEPLPYSFEGMTRGRRNDGGVEKVERSQRRMIKNRESAARSRARKQAYKVELEAEVQKLQEQNKELERKQEEMKESQKNEVPDMLKDPFGRKKRLCLRRTLTGPW